MIPSYSEEVKITIAENDSNLTIQQELAQLKEQVRQLYETVEYINRERSRLKSELEQVKSFLRS